MQHHSYEALWAWIIKRNDEQYDGKYQCMTGLAVNMYVYNCGILVCSKPKPEHSLL